MRTLLDGLPCEAEPPPPPLLPPGDAGACGGVRPLILPPCDDALGLPTRPLAAATAAAAEKGDKAGTLGEGREWFCGERRWLPSPPPPPPPSADPAKRVPTPLMLTPPPPPAFKEDRHKPCRSSVAPRRDCGDCDRGRAADSLSVLPSSTSPPSIAPPPPPSPTRRPPKVEDAPKRGAKRGPAAAPPL